MFLTIARSRLTTVFILRTWIRIVFEYRFFFLFRFIYYVILYYEVGFICCTNTMFWINCSQFKGKKYLAIYQTFSFDFSVCGKFVQKENEFIDHMALKWRCIDLTIEDKLRLFFLHFSHLQMYIHVLFKYFEKRNKKRSSFCFFFFIKFEFGLPLILTKI